MLNKNWMKRGSDRFIAVGLNPVDILIDEEKDNF